ACRVPRRPADGGPGGRSEDALAADRGARARAGTVAQGPPGGDPTAGRCPRPAAGGASSGALRGGAVIVAPARTPDGHGPRHGPGTGGGAVGGSGGGRAGGGAGRGRRRRRPRAPRRARGATVRGHVDGVLRVPGRARGRPATGGA